MNGISKWMMISLVFGFSSSAFAHKPGMYKIDNNETATVVFALVSMCPLMNGALDGDLRTFTFSETAISEKYKFQSGFYVETHLADGSEVYVKTDFNCVPTTESVGLLAKKGSLNGFSIELLPAQ